jgi:hypothetical protein
VKHLGKLLLLAVTFGFLAAVALTKQSGSTTSSNAPAGSSRLVPSLARAARRGHYFHRF